MDMSTKTTSRRTFLKAAVGTLGAGALATSGLQSGAAMVEAAASAVRTKAIEPQGTLWGLNYQPHVQAYHRLADLFHKQTGSTITVQPQPFPLDTKLIASVAAGTEPDVVCILANQTVGLAIQGAVQALNSSVYAYNHLNIAQDFVGDSVEAFTFRGSIYGVPIETDGGTGSVINVPVDDVNRLGLGSKYPPTNGQFNFESYDDVFTLAKALQVTQNGKVTRWGLCGEGWDDKTYWGIMLTLGQLPFDPASKTFHFDSPAGIQAMQLHVETPVKMGIETEWNDTGACVDEALAGKAAVTIGNGTPSLTINAAHGYNYKLAGVPKINGKQPVLSGTGDGWGFVAPVKAPHPNLATAFLRMMGTRAGQFQYDLTYGGVAIVAWTDILLHDTARFSPANNTNVTYQTRDVWAKVLPGVKYVGELGYYPKVSAAIISACQAVRERKMTSQQAVKQIQALAVAQYKQYEIDLQNLE
jgi:ABC-type glycerol-3-phosphate transport system substrate-binding protein